jgi:hypothetical protein
MQLLKVLDFTGRIRPNVFIIIVFSLLFALHNLNYIFIENTLPNYEDFRR